MRSLRDLDSHLAFLGIGGDRMRGEGAALFADSRDLAVVGLVEVLSHLAPIRAAFREARRILRQEPPDLALLIDYPDFNLRLAQEARRCGVPVVYFISPQVWAWRKSRLDVIKRCVDLMLVVLPFEEALYRERGVEVRFVGHPLLDILPPPMPPEEARRALQLAPGARVVGLLPGSRRREVAAHLPVMLEAACRLRRRAGEFVGVLPVASTLRAAEIEETLRARRDLPEIRLIEGKPWEALGAMDAAMIKSGTATLEAALMGVPMAIVYRTSPITYALASLLTDVPHVGLVNLVAGKRLAPELVQGDFEAEKLAQAMDALLANAPRRAAMRREMVALRERLGSPGCFARSATAVMDLLSGRSPA
jgi:lipid-A-disaccharide synthase